MKRSTTSKLIVMAFSLLLLLALGVMWAAFPTSRVSAGFTPTPTTERPRPGGGGDDGGGGGSTSCDRGAIYGSVADLCQGQPARGVEVSINGNIVRTDGDGRFSLTGLRPGTYNISIQVSGEWQPDNLTIQINECSEVTNVSLNYNSCILPTVTPTPTAVFFLPETGQPQPGSPLPLLLLLLVTGLVLFGAAVVYRRAG